MTLRSIYEGEFGYADGQFVELVSRWAGSQSLSGLEAWMDVFHKYDTSDQANILCDWIDKYCSTCEVESCIRYLLDITGYTNYDEQGFIIGD